MQIWDIINPLDATAFVRMLPDQLPNSLSSVLPDRTVPHNKSRRAMMQRNNVTAKFRSYDAETPIGQRPDTITVTEWQLPPIGQKLPVGEEETLRLQLEISGGSPSAMAALIQQMYDDMEQNVRAIRNRVELARGDLLTDGKFTLTDENGLTLEADWGVPATHTVTPGTKWDANGGTPLSNEKTYVQTLLVDGIGQGPDWVLASTAGINALLANAEYRAAAYPLAPSPPTLAGLGQLNNVRAEHNLAPITRYDHKVSVDGSVTSVIDPKLFIMGIRGFGEFQWGISAESLELARGSNGAFTVSDAPGLVSAVYRQIEPVRSWTKTSGVGMPVVAEPKGLVVVHALT
jgi:hypothetical protein